MSENTDVTETADADQVDGGVTDETTPDSTKQTSEEDSLGDPGKKALASMKEREKAARAETRELKKQLEDLQTQVANQDKSESEKAIEEARRNAETEALGKANERILRSEIKAAATGKLADPKDALAFLDLANFEVDDNGEVDSEDVSDAINKLLDEKPHLAAQGGRTPQFDSGRGKGIPSQLTKSDLNGMTPDQIETARKAGRLNSLLGK